MKKYFIIDWLKDGDLFDSKGYEVLEDALKEANYQWNNLSQHDKNRRSEFAVVIAPTNDDGYIDLTIGYDPVKIYK